MNNIEKEKLEIGLKKYIELEQELKSIEKTMNCLRNEIQLILEKNNLRTYEYEYENKNKKIVCIVYQTVKKSPELLKRILKNFYCSVVRKKINYLINQEKIEILVKNGKIKKQDAEKLLNNKKYLKIIIKGI